MADARLHGDTTKRSPLALLIVDVINDLEFDGGEDLLAPALAMTGPLVALKARAKQRGVPCIYANDNFGRWHSSFQKTIEACKATRGWPVASQLLPADDDYFILKPRHSAFHATPLELLLRDLGTKRIVLAGLAADNCVLFSAHDAYMRSFEVVIATDCVASEHDDWRDDALAHMQRVLKAELARGSEIEL